MYAKLSFLIRVFGFFFWQGLFLSLLQQGSEIRLAVRAHPDYFLLFRCSCLNEASKTKYFIAHSCCTFSYLKIKFFVTNLGETKYAIISLYMKIDLYFEMSVSSNKSQHFTY